VEQATLFTGEGNAPAQRTYRGPGFDPVGDYALTPFAP
jgi:hypothetical protein